MWETVYGEAQSH